MAGDTPREREGGDAADRPGEQPEAAVLQRQHRPEHPRARPERPQDRRLVDALELGHRHRAGEDQHAAQEGDAADDRDRERDVVDRGLHRGEHFAQVDGGDVRILRDQVTLETAARGRVLGRLEDADPHLRRFRQRPRAEDEHEAAAAGVFPLHFADARHARLEDAPDDVEAHDVADPDPRTLVQSLLDRDLGHRRVLGQRGLSDPEGAVGHLLVRLEMVAVGDGELAPQAALPHVLEGIEVGVLAADAGDPRAHHRNHARRVCPRGLARVDERAHRVDLGRQDLDQEHVGPARRQLERELLQEVGLQRADADHEEAADADREQDDAGLVAGTGQVEDGVPQREPARARHRPDGADERRRGDREDERDAGKPGADDQPHAQRRRLPARHGDERGADERRGADLRPVEDREPRANPRRRPPAGMAGRSGHARRRPAAQQQQRFHAADFEQRHQREQQRDEQADADPLRHGGRGQRVVAGTERRADAGRDGGETGAGERDAEDAPGQAEHHDLQHVGREHLAGRRADALQDRDALDLLADEHACHAPDADAAEHEDHEADETQIVLRAQEVLADLILGRAERARVDETRAEVAAHVLDELGDPGLLHFQEDLVVGAAAERQQPGPLEVVEIDQHARAEAEGADAPSRFLRDDAADGERLAADEDRVADRQAELREELGPDQRAAIGQLRVRELAAVVEDDLAVERKAGLHAAQLHHARDRRSPAVGRPHHRRDFDDLLARDDRRRREALLEVGAHFRRPRPVGGDGDVGRDQRARLARQRAPDRLDHRAQRDDRADADRHADEEEDQAAPRRADLTPRHQ